MSVFFMKYRLTCDFILIQEYYNYRIHTKYGAPLYTVRCHGKIRQETLLLLRLCYDIVALKTIMMSNRVFFLLHWNTSVGKTSDTHRNLIER